MAHSTSTDTITSGARSSQTHALALGTPFENDPTVGQLSSPRQASGQPLSRLKSAPSSTYASRSVDGDVGMGDPETRATTNLHPGPSSLRRSAIAQNYALATSSPDVMLAAQDGHSARGPPLVDHDTLESKEERRAKAWGRNLYGNAHVSGIRVPAPEGGLGIWFLFTVSRHCDVFVRAHVPALLI